jgi:hypothetical protein
VNFGHRSTALAIGQILRNKHMNRLSKAILGAASALAMRIGISSSQHLAETLAIGRQPMALLARIGQAPGAVAIIGRQARHVALQRLQRRRRRFQVDEPQLH